MEIKIEEQTCPCSWCGITFWVTVEYGSRKRQDKSSFYCPNGHAQSYQGETEQQHIERVIRAGDERLIALRKEKDAEIEVLRGELKQRRKARRPRKRIRS
jgi:hypothetical protein